MGLLLFCAVNIAISSLSSLLAFLSQSVHVAVEFAKVQMSLSCSMSCRFTTPSQKASWVDCCFLVTDGYSRYGFGSTRHFILSKHCFPHVCCPVGCVGSVWSWGGTCGGRASRACSGVPQIRLQPCLGAVPSPSSARSTASDWQPICHWSEARWEEVNYSDLS